MVTTQQYSSGIWWRASLVTSALAAAIWISAPSCAPQLGVSRQALGACVPVVAFGAIADDGLDDRAALQLALDAGCVWLAAGRYDVDTPPMPRYAPYALLTMPAGAEVFGVGDTSVIAYRGDPGKQVWIGLYVGDGALIHHLRLENENLAAGQTHEQTHLIRAVGPLSPGPEIHHVTFDSPVVPGSSRGDPIQIVGYPPDQWIEGMNIHDNRFLRTARSCLSVHGGLRGVTPGVGPVTCRFSDNVAIDPSDQCFDGEGGDDPGPPYVSDCEISNNLIYTGPHAAGGLAIQVVRSERLHIHHNTLVGRGIDLAACSGCEFDHNTVTQTFASDFPAELWRKASIGSLSHDNVIERFASAGNKPALGVLQLVSAPAHITIRDSRVTQHATSTVIATTGVTGFTVQGSTLIYDGGAGQYGIDMAGTSGATGVRTTDLHVLDTSIASVGASPLKAAVRISGYGGGTGTLQLERVSVTNAMQGLRCEQTATYATIWGPVTYAGNTMPAPSCGAVPME